MRIQLVLLVRQLLVLHLPVRSYGLGNVPKSVGDKRTDKSPVDHSIISAAFNRSCIICLALSELFVQTLFSYDLFCYLLISHVVWIRHWGLKTIINIIGASSVGFKCRPFTGLGVQISVPRHQLLLLQYGPSKPPICKAGKGIHHCFFCR